MVDIRAFFDKNTDDLNYLKYIHPNELIIADQIVGTIEKNLDSLSESFSILELGCRLGTLSRMILERFRSINVLSIEEKSILINKTKKLFYDFVQENKLTFIQDDILSAVRKIESDSISYVVSHYTIHNYTNEYRLALYSEIYRVLKTGGLFLNGDQIASDNDDDNIEMIQGRAKHYINILRTINKTENISPLITHLIYDTSSNIIMKDSVTLNDLRKVKFHDIEFINRINGECVIKAEK
ncbi:MAG: class I SAM-dependent methyltransferase [bacterium]|nr:class I SAM-dependent methyltransferase [bacterium]